MAGPARRRPPPGRRPHLAWRPPAPTDKRPGNGRQEAGQGQAGQGHAGRAHGRGQGGAPQAQAALGDLAITAGFAASCRELPRAPGVLGVAAATSAAHDAAAAAAAAAALCIVGAGGGCASALPPRLLPACSGSRCLPSAAGTQHPQSASQSRSPMLLRSLTHRALVYPLSTSCGRVLPLLGLQRWTSQLSLCPGDLLSPPAFLGRGLRVEEVYLQGPLDNP
jgi:hypothetical protein